MKRTFAFSAGMDAQVVIEVDLDVLTVQTATDMNDFWSSSKEVLEACDGDVILAATRRAAAQILYLLVDGEDEETAISKLCEDEGWPPKDQLGMTILDYDIPEFATLSLIVNEITAAPAGGAP